MQQEQRPTDEEIAVILLANGLEPDKHESNVQYIRKFQQFLRQNGNPLSEVQINNVRDNITSIRVELQIKVNERNFLCTIGNYEKWIHKVYECLIKAKGWNQLRAITTAYKPSKKAYLFFGNFRSQNNMWVVTGIIAAIQVGLQFKKWYTGQISAKQFYHSTGKILVIDAASVAGGAGGAYAGAAIGMACGGPIGSIVGIIIGGISGSLAASYGTQKLLQYTDDKYQQYTANRLIQQALNFFQLPSKCSLETLERQRKAKFMNYHPDRWLDASQKKQKEMEKKLYQTMQYYQILKVTIEVIVVTKTKKALQFFQLPNSYSQSDLERLKQMKLMQYHPDKWIDESLNKRLQIANKLKKTKKYYDLLKYGLIECQQIHLLVEE